MRSCSSGIAAALVAATCLVTPVLAKPRDPVSLARAGKWEVNYDVDACHLISGFGPEKQRIVARFTRFEPGEWFYLDLYGKDLRSSATGAEQVAIDFGPEPGGQSVMMVSGRSGDIPTWKFGTLHLLDRVAGTVTADLPSTPEQERAVQAVTVRRGRKALRLELGPMDGPMRALRACNDDLVKYWGYDPAQQAALNRRPEPLSAPTTWLGSNDYPLVALQAGANGIVQFRLDVAADGSVGGCHVQARTNPDQFAERSCALLTRRARFQPALDKDGKPVGSYFVSRVYWMMP